MKLSEFISEEIEKSVMINDKKVGTFPKAQVYGIKYPKCFYKESLKADNNMPRDIRDIINEYIDDVMKPAIDKLSESNRELLIKGAIPEDEHNWYNDRCYLLSQLMDINISLKKYINFIDTCCEDRSAFWFTPYGKAIVPILNILTIDNGEVCKIYISKTGELCIALTNDTFPFIRSRKVSVTGKISDTCYNINIGGYPSINDFEINKLLDSEDKSLRFLLDNNIRTVAETKHIDLNAKYLTCPDCNNTFIVGEKEAKWYKDKGLKLPKRCKECRNKRKSNIPKS